MSTDGWYARWHAHPLSSVVHWSAFLAVSLSTSALLVSAINPTAASAAYVPFIPPYLNIVSISASDQVLSRPAVFNNTDSNYGIHYPQGLGVVKRIYGSSGNWKQARNVKNIYSYYAGWKGLFGNQEPTGTTTEVLDLSYYAANEPTSVPDSNNHTLFHLAYGATEPAWITAFVDHFGIGEDGHKITRPFYQFWFDDNWLARYMANAYGAPLPSGLWDPQDFNRWKILGGDTTNWGPYPGNAPDQLALNGLYYLARGDINMALAKWKELRTASGAVYDSPNQQYVYPKLTDVYHIGLFKILTDKLLYSGKLSSTDYVELLQHTVALRSNILSLEQGDADAGNFVGWLSNINPDGALLNTETTAVMVLALGTSARYTFEAGREPLQTPSDASFFFRPYNALSAVVGLSRANTHMIYGPYFNLPPRSYYVDFYLRTPSPVSQVANLDIYDSQAGLILGSQVVSGSQMNVGNKWSIISVPIVVTNPQNVLEFRVWWYGKTNLDVSEIRVRDR